MFESTDFADYNIRAVGIANSAGFKSPQLAALVQNFSHTDTP
jgi:hypothetical protein